MRPCYQHGHDIGVAVHGEVGPYSCPDPCPYLEVAPEVRGGQYTGGFVALHQPTGLTLGGFGLMTPETVRLAIQYVSFKELDWSSPERQHYQDQRDVYETAWREAVHRAEDYIEWGGE